MHDAEIAKALWQISPRATCAIAVEHCIDEQPVVFCSGSGPACLAGQQLADALPVGVKQCASFAHRPKVALGLGLSTMGTLIDDTPITHIKIFGSQAGQR